MSIGGHNTFRRPEESGARNTQERIRLIVNPRAGAGRAGTGIDALKRAADRAFAQWEIKVTQAPGHASELASEAATEGFDLVAAVGGDGTCHEVVNGLIKDGRARNRKTAFAVVPAGTGGDLTRTLGVPKRLQDALWLAATGITLPSDVGVATFTDQGEQRSRVFINVAGFGANGAVAQTANNKSKKLGGRVTFLLSTIEVLASYQPTPVNITLHTPNGEQHWSGPLVSGFVANGAYCGGGMWVGKGGTMQDGLFNITMIEPTSRVRQAIDGRYLFNGNLSRARGIHQYLATSLSIEPINEAVVPIELDGESPGHGPAEFKIVPRCLPVRGGWMP